VGRARGAAKGHREGGAAAPALLRCDCNVRTHLAEDAIEIEGVVGDVLREVVARLGLVYDDGAAVGQRRQDVKLALALLVAVQRPLPQTDRQRLQAHGNHAG
jgi:hypothetical protein